MKHQMENKSSFQQGMFEKIKELYLSNGYHEVIRHWENYGSNLRTGIFNQEDLMVLEAVATSYYELKRYKESLVYFTYLIERIRTCEFSNNLKKQKSRNYYLYKIDIYNKLRIRVSEYRTIREYLKNFGSDESFQKLSDSLEIYFLRKYVIINKCIAYIILSLIVISIVASIFGIQIPRDIYRPYNILTGVFVIWIIVNLLVPNYFKGLLINCLRYRFSIN